MTGQIVGEILLFLVVVNVGVYLIAYALWKLREKRKRKENLFLNNFGTSEDGKQ